MIIAFILDGLISRYFTVYPVLTLLSLVYEKKDNYLKVVIIGLLYDIVYTDTLFLNTILFYSLFYSIKYYFKYFKRNFLNIMLLSTLLIISYRLITYVVLLMTNYLKINILSFGYILLMSFISLIYTIIRYLYKNLL